MLKDYVGIGEAAQILGLSRTSIQKLVDSGQIAAIKTAGGHRRILRCSLEDLNHKMGYKAGIRFATALHQPVNRTISSDATSGVDHQDEMPVLIVEDDAASAALLVGIFKKDYPGVRCIVATDGLDAVLQLERTRPRILITDLNMEPFDGFRLINMVSERSEYNSIAIVVTSGISDKEIEQRGGLPSNVLFFRKPVSMERLKGFMDAYVQMHRQHRIVP
jgi:excisionase family DNA binding protein